MSAQSYKRVNDIMIQAFINRSKRAGFCSTELNDFDALCAKADNELFRKILNSPDHVLHLLLPPPVSKSIRSKYGSN